MTLRPRLSIVIPAFNEAGNIVGTLANVTSAVERTGLDAEILVVDDGSTDGTGDLVVASRERFPGVALLVNDRNRGFGWTYRRGVGAASGDYVVMVHGDNAWDADTLARLFGHVGQADIVIGFTRDMWRSRSWARTAMSKAFTALVNAITGRRLRYYNGLQIHCAGVLKSLEIESTGYGFQAEVLVKALRLTRTFIEVPMELTERERGGSKAFRVRNLVDVARTVARLCRIRVEAGLPVTTFARSYLDDTATIARALDADAIERVAALLALVRARGGRLFFLGVGGGAAHASHAVNDCRKLAGFESYAPTDNVSELTARTNDEGWATTFVAWLKVSRLGPADGVFVFSVGGGQLGQNVSPNLVRALEHAQAVGAAIAGIVGRDGGFTASVADACVVVPTVDAGAVTPHTEGMQAVVWHLLVSHPSLKCATAKWESMR